MRIGIPQEIKVKEGRVALNPAAAGELAHHGHEVFIQSGAGKHCGYSDQDYIEAGLTVLPDAETLYGETTLIVKVKEPQGDEVGLLREDHLLFSFLHLAAAPELMKQLMDTGLIAVAFETIPDSQGRLPLLAPMSDIAGRLSVQIGSNLLFHYAGGRGVLLGGLPAAERGRVVILGGGVAGGNAAAMAAAMGAEVVVFERKRDRLATLRNLGPNVTGLYPFADSIREQVAAADLLVGAILITGQRAPHLVDAGTVRQMRPGSVIVDISVDQGGCIETTRPTDYEQPTFIWEGVLHFGVTNMPGAVPRSATQALSAALVPYILRLTEPGWEQAADLAAGINVSRGKLVYPGLDAYL